MVTLLVVPVPRTPAVAYGAEVPLSATESRRIDFKIDLTGQNGIVLAGHFYPARNQDRGLLQVLIHGNSYDHRYWDAGEINGNKYSYAHYMADRGYAVLALDLPGTGDSSKPNGDSVGLDGVSDALALIIAQLRGADEPLGCRIDRVALVGHSLGTIVSIYAQATRQPADIVVATGVGALPPAGPSPFGTALLSEALEQEYVLLPAAARRRVFYHPPTTDPEVATFDNEHLLNSLPRRLYTESFAARSNPKKSRAADVKCLVYVQLGEHDPIAPGSSLPLEETCWPGSIAITVEQLGDIGHCFNLHLNREIGWHRIDQYLSAH